MSAAKAKPPERCQGVAGQREPGPVSGRGDVVSFPPIADYGVPVGRHTGALVAPGTCPNMTIIVSDGKTPVTAGAR
jgi:hypothetical protein